MELPRNIVIGHDALLAVGEVCQALKLGKKALIVADENTIKIAGKTVEKELTGRKIRHSEYLIPDATWEEVRDGEERIRKGDFEFAIGVGGGRSIDVAKCASFNAGVPFVSVPTAASHDGVVSSRASIQKDGEKVSIGAQTPIAVIMDTGVIAESPFRLLARRRVPRLFRSLARCRRTRAPRGDGRRGVPRVHSRQDRRDLESQGHQARGTPKGHPDPVPRPRPALTAAYPLDDVRPCSDVSNRSSNRWRASTRSIWVFTSTKDDKSGSISRSRSVGTYTRFRRSTGAEGERTVEEASRTSITRSRR